jgi:diguanylate cyclase (GGDEF)-like protein
MSHVQSRAHSRLRIAAWLLLLTGWFGSTAAQQFSFRQYAQSDGLTNLAAGYLATDPAGDIWVGTDGGLFRFDGTAFVPYDTTLGLPSETVRGMALDPWDRLWVTLDRGLYVGGRNRPFEPVRTGSGPVITDHSLPIAFLEQGHVLVAHKGQVLELRREHPDAGVWTAHPMFPNGKVDHVVSLFTATDGTLWLGCGKQLCSKSADGLRTWGIAEGVPEGSYGAFLLDRNGRLWVRSGEHLLVRELGATNFVVADPPHARLESRVVEPMLTLDASGRLLTRTAPGVARWDGAHWEEFSTDNGLADAVVAKAQVDGEGSLWLSPLGLGVWRWRGYDNVESWTRAQGFVSQKVWNIKRDHQGRLLVGTERGCQMLDERAASVTGCPFEGMPNVEDIALAVDARGGVWYGLENSELWTIPPHEKRAHLVKMPGGKVAVSIIFFDRDGTGWVVCYSDGLYQLNPNTEQLQKVELPRPEARIYDITQDRHGTLWVAATGGFFHFVDGQWSFVQVRNEDGSDGVYSSLISMSDGSIWASNFGKGLLHASGPNLEHRWWIKPEVLADASVYSVRKDSHNRLWANTDQGAVIFDGQNWLRFDIEDGLAGNDTEAFSFLHDADGSVWIGTAGGMTHIRDPDRLLHPQGKLDLRIASARFGDHMLDVNHASAVQWRADAALDVRFTSHNYSRSPQTEFRYRLLGLSSRWFGSRSPELHLPALDGGHYTLEIMAIDAPHARKSDIITMSFEVIPPWWRTMTFKACVALLALSLLSLVWRLQLGKLRARRLALEKEFREREQLLERATRDSLTGLWNRSSVLEFLSGELLTSLRTGAPLALALIDVDHFKQVNDTYGHHGGDEVLRELAMRLSKTIRQGDWLGRYGGEELMIVMPGLSYVGAATPIERLRECVAETAFTVGDCDVNLTVSIGMAWVDSPLDTTHEMIRRADSALYSAKRSGRNRVVYPPSPRDPNAEATGSRRYMVELRDRLKREAH